MTAELIILRGVSGSGKSTWARSYQATFPDTVIVNRDSLRFAIYNNYFGGGINEDLITEVQNATITAGLNAGKNVIVDNTNIQPKYIKPIAKLAGDAPVNIKQFDVPLIVALQRNAGRDRKVPDDVIKKQFQGLKTNPTITLQTDAPVVAYVTDRSKSDAICVDIDGTLAKNISRGFYDWTKVYEDEVVEYVRDLVKLEFHAGTRIIILSGRDGSCYEQTYQWLTDYVVHFDDLFMRAENDMRPDTVVKLELFDKYIRNRYNVKYVIDDRPVVCRQWRKMGLNVFQVGNPHKEF